MKPKPIRLRPDHVIWVLKHLYRRDGHDRQRHHGGQAVLASLAHDLQRPVELVCGADDVCAPCRYNHHGQCTDRLAWTDKCSKQQWLEQRDASALALLKLQVGTIMPARQLFECFARRLPDLNALRPRHSELEPASTKGQQDQDRYAQGLKLIQQA